MVQDESLVVSLIQRHLKYTKSTVARAILNDWQNAKQHFVKVFPHEYARALREQTETKVRPPACMRFTHAVSLLLEVIHIDCPTIPMA